MWAKGWGDYGDVSPVPLESHDPWAKSLHSIMNESVGTNGHLSYYISLKLK
ncbi:MAG: hypothetical protein RXR43_00175 [Sulfolobus sp.]